MKIRMSIRLLTVWLLLLIVVRVPAVEPPTGYPPVADLLGLQTDDGHGWLAIRVDFEDTHALSGVLWYNNDSQVTFPSLSIGTGHLDGPAPITEALVVAMGVSGVSDDWSTWIFDQPVAASLGGLYVIFEFPAGNGFVGRGDGGGPAVGFSDGLTEPAGWISGDGESWFRLAGDFGFAVAPVLVPYEEGMLVKSLGDDRSEDGAPDIPSEAYVKAGPNPFNPQIAIQFGLPQASQVTLVVYDIRGRRVVRLLDEARPAGHHSVTWRGRDDGGRRVASGVYFARFQSGGLTSVKRVTLVK